MRSKGVKKLQREGRGDQFVKIVVEIPRNLNKKQKELIAQFEKELSDKNFEKRKVFFERLRGSKRINYPIFRLNKKLKEDASAHPPLASACRQSGLHQGREIHALYPCKLFEKSLTKNVKIKL